MRKTLLIAIVLGLGFSAIAQTTYKLKINHKLGSSDFAMATTSKNDLNHDFNVTRLEYYLSGFELVHDGGKTTKLSDVYALVNASTATNIELVASDVTTIEGIRFSVGVDAGVNNADPTQWPASHALAPKSPSMHWGWSAGYRFIAMEGKAGNNLAYTYQVHALGNQNYFQLEIPLTADSEGQMELNADYTKALSAISISSGVITHGAYDEAVTMLRNFQNKVFTSLDGKGNTLSAKSVELPHMSLYPNPSNGVLNVYVPGGVQGDVRIFDVNGRLVQQHNMVGEAMDFIIEEQGVYFVQVISDEGYTQTQRIVVQ